MTAHSSTPILPAETCATAFGASAATSTNRWLFSSSRSTWMTLGVSSIGVVETNSVASARPYDGLTAVSFKP